MTVRIITKESLRQDALQRRIQTQQTRLASQGNNAMTLRAISELENGQIPRAQFPDGFDIRQHIRVVGEGKQSGAEFVSTGDFAASFYQRQQYEVEAGRDEEPLIYPTLYSVVTDGSLPRSLTINTLGPAGVVFEEITEGGEVKFASVGEGEKVVTMKHYGVGLEYTEDLFIYNELWRLPNIERGFGVAHNALLNHIHMTPILSHTHKAANKTDGTALTTFKAAAAMPEKYLRAIESAISSASTDKTNPRRGPYILVVSSADVFTVERALNRVPQQGFDLQTSALNRVRAVVEYDGWTGTRGKKQVAYDGVTAGKGYLVDISSRMFDFQSFFKQPLRQQRGDGDLTRFIIEQVVWDTRFGVFADPDRAVHEITWPVAASGAS
jgi:hypothetical protein